MSAIDDVRVEVAFDTAPDAEQPFFTDLTRRAQMGPGITNQRGRNDQFDAPSSGRCSLRFDNDDGALTPGLASSPFYPKVKPQNRIRVTYRDPAVGGNFLDAESATFEGGTVGGWTGAGGATPTNSTTRAFGTGTRSMLVTWPAAAANASSASWSTDPVLVGGRDYVVRARVWVPAGHPPVRLAFVSNFFPFYGNPSTTNGAWEWISATLPAATRPELIVVLRANAATTAGQQVWVDEVRVDEAIAPAAFTATPISQVIIGRYDGHVHEWPNDWPTGGANRSDSAVTAFDVTARLARRRKLGSVIAETYRLNAPSWYFPLDEPAGATSAGDRTNLGASLAIQQVGAGGAVTFAAATGAPTDSASSPQFTPVSVNAGQYLRGEVPRTQAWTFGVTLEAVFNTSTVAVQTIARIEDPSGAYLELSIDASGRPTATFSNPWVTSVSTSHTVAATDGRTHTIAATITIDAGTGKSLRLYVDGVQRGSVMAFNDFIYLPNLSTILSVGGTPGRCFTGTVSHIAAFSSPLLAADLTEHYNAAMTGFSGERSDQRIARVLKWVGFPTSRQALDVGLTRIGHIDPTGRDPMSIITDVATTEAGLAFADVWGKLTFYGRGRRYQVTQAAAFTATGDDIEPDTASTNSVEDLVNAATVTRSGGGILRAEDAASIAANGIVEKSVEIFADSDLEAFARAQWLIARGATPQTRLPVLGLDALTATPAARGLELGQRGSVSGLPPQLTSTAGDVIVEGYTETISSGSGWVIKANTGPFMPVRPLILNDGAYGVLDSTNCLVY